MAFEQRGLHVVTTLQLTTEMRLATTNQHFSTFLLAQIKVRKNFGQLLL